MPRGLHVYRTEAIVLRRMDLAEADRLLTLYTPRRGKIRVVARGVRRTQSRMAGHIELFCHTDLLMAQARNLDIVTQAQVKTLFPGLRDNLDRVTEAYYVAELVDRLCPEDQDHPEVFTLLRAALDHIALGGLPHALHLRHLELHLLDATGFKPTLYQCAQCGASVEPTVNAWNPQLGGVICPACAPICGRYPLSLAALKVLRTLASRPYEALPRIAVSQELAAELERALRDEVQSIIERDLRSTTMLEASAR